MDARRWPAVPAGVRAAAAAESRPAPWLVRVGLCVVFLSVPVSISGMQIGLGIALLGGILDGLGWRHFARTPLDEPLLAFLGITLLSAVLSAHPAASLRSCAGQWIVLLMYLVAGYFRGAGGLRRLLPAMFWPAGLMALYGIAQHYTGWNFLRGGGEPLHSLLIDGTVVYFPRGTFSHYQTFANVYFLLFCLSLSLATTSVTRGERLRWAAPSILLGVVLVLSFTRGIWLAMLVAGLVFAALHLRRAARLLLPLLGIALLVAALAPRAIFTRARSIYQPRTNVERLLLWETTWNMLRDRPLLGVGLGNYKRAQGEYLREEVSLPMTRTHSHNVLLQVAVERGVFGLLAFLWMVATIFREGAAALRRLRPEGGTGFALAAGVVAGLAGFFVDGMFQNNFGDSEVAVLFWLLVGMLLAAGRGAQAAPEKAGGAA